jgi:hypothetical protein
MNPSLTASDSFAEAVKLLLDTILSVNQRPAEPLLAEIGINMSQTWLHKSSL